MNVYFQMLSRDILEEQDLEYTLALIEDMERELKTKVNEITSQENMKEVEVCVDEKEVDTEEEVENDVEEENPSPSTLRNIRLAYFDTSQIQPPQIQPPQIQPPQIQPPQIQPPRMRLRSGRSY